LYLTKIITFLGANSQQSPLNQMHLGLQLVSCLTEHNLEYVCGDWQW